MNETTSDNSVGNNSDLRILIEKKINADLLSFGVSKDEISAMPLKKAWNLLRQKNLENGLKNPQTEISVTLEDMDNDFDILMALFNLAKKKVVEKSDPKKVEEIFNVAGENNMDSSSLEQYLKDNLSNLSPDEKSLIEISVSIKQFRAKAKEMMYEDEEANSLEEGKDTQ